MDQLKEQLVKIKPYAFWIACVVILLGTVGVWYMATSTLTEQRTAAKAKIDGAFNGLNGINPKLAKHPNPGTNIKMVELSMAYGEEIARGWDLQYRRQEGVLVWPASFDQDFQDAVKDLRPIEKVPVKTAELRLMIPESFRRRYRDFIEDELPRLATTIGGRWQATRDASGAPGGGEFAPTAPTRMGPDGRPIEEHDRSMVLWSPENQKSLLTEHFGFTARANDPTTLDVLYAQEDLWVLQNLMEIIKRTNDGYEGRHDAAVKQIEFVRIGRSALGLAGKVMSLGNDPNAPGGARPPGFSEGGGMQTAPPGTAAAPGAPPTNPSTDPSFNAADPCNWRYVDKNNVPLAGFQLRQAIEVTAPGAPVMGPTNPDAALLAVAKRMPVRLRLEIDQRRLAKLLTEFGNAPLPVEVRQLRFNREPAPIGNPSQFFAMNGLGGGGGGGEGFSAAPPGGGFGGQRGEGIPGMGTGAGSLTRDATVDTNLIKLELYGIVYIYNPVNRAKLGLPAAPAGATAMSNAPATNAGG
ncbi:hypothetical protein [Anatilimnocola floriformis]|uniref:hypothetical protein n=1 Tax=Anatilimnocola floriformis TaxID=2948575 RepID=UPI0020C29B45|nr:hypothetical protein [Anatilimnocola floriformis]